MDIALSSSHSILDLSDRRDSLDMTQIKVDKTSSFISFISKIEPSPDWFGGLNGLNLIDGGSWLREVVVELFPFDAGADAGDNYTSSNIPEAPSKEIVQFTPATIPQSTRVFENPEGTAVLSVATLTCELFGKGPPSPPAAPVAPPRTNAPSSRPTVTNQPTRSETEKKEDRNGDDGSNKGKRRERRRRRQQKKRERRQRKKLLRSSE